MTKSSRKRRVTRRRRLLLLGSTSPRGGEIAGGVRRGLCWQNAVELLHPSAGDGLFGRSGGRNYTLLEAAT
ncbi:hypothetical protein F2Q68_00026286 [Brassica cretica]|uniref:Uncharacterized protein n=2 Tax=Brassica cretica TaxID=69181 RepID=A0ABQ7DKT4_BRACR|nr:hypothetical protein F2Q68_00026286 [Brassica cretica]KAF3577978.1 hypothetical protein DY000_02032525 [Brassica cretica]